MNKNDIINPVEVSRGSFGTVHKVENINIKNKFFAIKEMIPNNSDEKLKIEKEILMWEKFEKLQNKPCSLPKYYGSDKENFGLNRTNYHLIFDFFPLSLKEIISDLIKTNSKMPFSQLFQYFKSSINCLAYLQTMGICHRDLKPANVLLDENKQQIYLIDFGESKEIIIASNDETKKELTLAGSPKYFSPELANDFEAYENNNAEFKTKLNPFKSDVFSLGLIFLELANLKLPNKNDLKNQVNIQFELSKLQKNYETLLKLSYL